MSILRELLEDETESVYMPKENFITLLENAIEEIEGETDEEDPIIGFDIVRIQDNKYDFSYTYNGLHYSEIIIRISEE